MSESKSRKSSTSIERIRREKKKRNNNIILACFLSLFVGHYILNYVAAIEEPPLGATFNIVLGCTIIAVAGIIMLVTIKRQYFPKKRKKTKHIFLDEDYKEKISTRKKHTQEVETDA
ncbi:hypothetical protein KIH23_12605 [Flavobacterium sp. CYK-55]|uniref:hypothetical protein n=1 Tax=Flavobacterium sp. CYK-55 TaxID=2835529 RepID=UPI001BCC9A32|nr:hypothetical protein [Flavobacterium sp. CYK-55]MBS7788140.1 hypothetical protein [Flavobacterium sp. CYK-55]